MSFEYHCSSSHLDSMFVSRNSNACESACMRNTSGETNCFLVHIENYVCFATTNKSMPSFLFVVLEGKKEKKKGLLLFGIT